MDHSSVGEQPCLGCGCSIPTSMRVHLHGVALQLLGKHFRRVSSRTTGYVTHENALLMRELWLGRGVVVLKVYLLRAHTHTLVCPKDIYFQVSTTMPRPNHIPAHTRTPAHVYTHTHTHAPHTHSEGKTTNGRVSVAHGECHVAKIIGLTSLNKLIGSSSEL